MKQFFKIIATIILLLIVGVKEIDAQNQHPKFTFKIERKADGYYYAYMKSDLALSRAKFETTIATNQFTLVSALGTFAPAAQTTKSPINMTNFEDLLPVISADKGTYQWSKERTNANVGNTSTTTEYTYFSLNASPALTDISANVEIPLFRFKTLTCIDAIRMYRNVTDADGSADKPKYNSGNSANISGANGGLDDTYNGNYGGSAYCTAPDLVTTIGQPSPSPVAGQPSLIPVNVKNIGSAPSSGPITLVVQIPTGTSFGSFPTNNNGWTCSTSGTTATCTNPIVLAPGTLGTDFTVPFIPAASQVGTTLTIPPAKVSGGGEPVDKQNNNDSDPIQPTPPVTAAPAPDLVTTTGQPSPSPVAGQPSSLPVNVKNIGSSPSSGPITVVVTIPTGTTFGTFLTPANNNGWTCSATTATTATCTNPIVLAPGTLGTDFKVPFIPAASQVGTTLTIPPAKVSGGGEPVDKQGNNDSNPITTPPTSASGTPDLKTTITSPNTGLPGTPFDYTVSIDNMGTQPSSGSVTESITIPAGLTFNSGGGNGFVCTPSTGPLAGPVTINCTNPAPNIPSGGNTSFPINVTPTTTGSFTATGSVSGGQDGNLTNNNTPSNPIQIGCGINAGVLSKN